MRQEEQAREIFEKLLHNIIERVRAASAADREAILDNMQMTLRAQAMKHGLSEHQAGTWAAEIDQEVRFRLGHGASGGTPD
jgi:hypothetical protein